MIELLHYEFIATSAARLVIDDFAFGARKGSSCAELGEVFRDPDRLRPV